MKCVSGTYYFVMPSVSWGGYAGEAFVLLVRHYA